MNKITHNSKPSHAGSVAGFTLVELLVTILLTAIMGLFVVQTLLFVTKRSQSTIQQAHTTDELALIAQTLEKDITTSANVTYQFTEPTNQTIQFISQVTDTVHYEISKGLLTRNGFLLHDKDIRMDSLRIDTTESLSRNILAKSFAIYYAVKGESHVSKHIAIKSN